MDGGGHKLEAVVQHSLPPDPLGELAEAVLQSLLG